eukprot:scaffold297572_cov17-Tisochrysis_lutea.AAC.2
MVSKALALLRKKHNFSFEPHALTHHGGGSSRTALKKRLPLIAVLPELMCCAARVHVQAAELRMKARSCVGARTQSLIEYGRDRRQAHFIQ